MRRALSILQCSTFWGVREGGSLMGEIVGFSLTTLVVVVVLRKYGMKSDGLLKIAREATPPTTQVHVIFF